MKNNKKNVDEEILETEELAEDLVEELEAVEIEETEIEDEVEVLKARVRELEDALLRDKAEVENFKRRMKQEYETNLKFSNQVLIENMLPVLDSFERALEGHEDASDEVKNFLKGVEMIYTLLTQVLESEGLTTIAGAGSQFDPYVHQAVLKEFDETIDDNLVVEELQKGYKLKDRVLRASMVKVNSKE